MITTRLATAADIDAYFGARRPGTLKAYVALIDDEVCGVVGVVRDRGVGRYFADFNEKLQPHIDSIKIMRAVKASLRFCDEYRGPVISVAEHAEGCRLLFRLGFEHLDGEYYAWLN